MKIQPKDLLVLKDYARDAFLKIQQGAMLGNHELSHGDKIALAFFQASAGLIGKLGIDPKEAEVLFSFADSDPEADDYDWIEDPDQDP